MKKLLAVILSVLMALTAFMLPAFAAEDEEVVLTGETLDAAVEAAAAALLPVSSDAVVDVQSNIEQAAVNASDLALSFAKYIFLTPEQVDALSSAIAEDAAYTVTVMENGKKTVYISVDLREHPEIANLDVFKEAVRKLSEKQGESIDPDDEEYDLMDYQHIAGELALHVIVAAAMTAIGRDETDSTLQSAVIADLNKDESRLPSAVFEFIGRFIMEYLLNPLQTLFAKIFKF